MSLISAVDRITTFDTSQLPCKVAATVKRGTQPGEFNLDQWVPKAVITIDEYMVADIELIARVGTKQNHAVH